MQSCDWQTHTQRQKKGELTESGSPAINQGAEYVGLVHLTSEDYLSHMGCVDNRTTEISRQLLPFPIVPGTRFSALPRATLLSNRVQAMWTSCPAPLGVIWATWLFWTI